MSHGPKAENYFFNPGGLETSRNVEPHIEI